jgi:hypothetical protein
MSHRSKIAALPESIREQLNHRLANGHSGKTILPWLNGLPEVQAVLAERFHNEPLSYSNLTQWRKTGFHDWLDSREARQLVAELAREAAKLSAANQSSIAQGALALASLRLMQAIPDRPSHPPAALAPIVRALVAVRSSELALDRLDADHKKLQLWKREVDLLERRVKLLENKSLRPPPDPPPGHPGGGLSPETLARIQKEAHLL